MDRDRNQHSDPSGAPVDPRGPMSTQNFTRNSFLIVLEGIGDAKCSKNSKYNLNRLTNLHTDHSDIIHDQPDPPWTMSTQKFSFAWI